MPARFQKLVSIGWGIAAAGCLAALGIYGLVGAFMRFIGDDYCYGMILNQKGFWTAQWYSYTVPTPYTGDRYSLTFFSDVFHSFGPGFYGWLAGLTLLAWLAGLVMVARQLNCLLDWQRKRFVWAAGAAGFAFLVLYQAPDLAESFYWRSGMLPYFMPLVGDTWMAAWLLAMTGRKNVGVFTLAGVGLFAFVNAGFSETAVALQAGGLGMALLGTLLVRRESNSFAAAWKPFTAALAGTAAGMVVMLVSPSNAARLGTLPESLGLTASVQLSFRYALDFIRESMQGLPIPTLIGLAIATATGFELATGSTRPIKMSWRHWLTASILTLVVGYGLVVCSVAPSVFIQTWYPEPRALIVSRFAMELSIFVLGGLAGAFLHGLLTGRRVFTATRIALVLLIGLCAAYALRGGLRRLPELPNLRNYAAQWDQRDAQIRADRDRGLLGVEVTHLPHLLLHIGDINEDAGYWYNVCAAGNYGIHSIHSVP